MHSKLYRYVTDTELQLSGKKCWKIPKGQSESILGVAYFVFFHAWQNKITYFMTDYYQFVRILTILKITALLMIFLNVFIHSHDEWFVKCWKVTCLDRLNFWNRTIIEITQKIRSSVSTFDWNYYVNRLCPSTIVFRFWQQSKCFLEKW